MPHRWTANARHVAMALAKKRESPWITPGPEAAVAQDIFSKAYNAGARKYIQCPADFLDP